MSYEIRYTHSYIKRAKKFLTRHPELISQYEKTLTLLSLNPHHKALRLHKLTGKQKGLYSISINMQYRIVMEFLIKDDVIIPIDIGGHEVYQ